jgi:hypothetical protein
MIMALGIILGILIAAGIIYGLYRLKKKGVGPL